MVLKQGSSFENCDPAVIRHHSGDQSQGGYRTNASRGGQRPYGGRGAFRTPYSDTSKFVQNWCSNTADLSHFLRWLDVPEFKVWSGAGDLNPGPHGPELYDLSSTEHVYDGFEFISNPGEARWSHFRG